MSPTFKTAFSVHNSAIQFAGQGILRHVAEEDPSSKVKRIIQEMARRKRFGG